MRSGKLNLVKHKYFPVRGCGVAACCVLLGGGLFCVNFAGGVAEAEVFEGVEDLAVCFWIGIFGLVEKAVVVFEAGVECGIESCKDFFLGGDGSVFVLETVVEDCSIDYACEVGLVPSEEDVACWSRCGGHGFCVCRS